MNKQTIKYITILEEEPIILEDGKKYNTCKCECGNIKYILNSTLKSKRIRDCGCGKYMLDRMIGVRSGKLTVIETFRERRGKNQRVNIMCRCQCDCGNIIVIPASKLKGQYSCGCAKFFDFAKYKNKIYNGIEVLELVDEKEKIISCKCKCGNIFTCKLSKLTSHKNPIIGCSKCPDFVKYTRNTKYLHKYKAQPNRIKRIHRSMKLRCFNPKDKDFDLYGGRGISICRDWIGENGFQNFEEWAINNGYKDDLTIDRMDTNGNYEPKNCRWVDIKTQANNRRNNVKYLFNNEELTIPEISRIVNINKNTILSRLKKGYSLERAINTPVQRRTIIRG